MEWTITGTNFLYAAFGLVQVIVAYWVIGRLTPEVDFPAEAKRGNIARFSSRPSSSASR